MSFGPRMPRRERKKKKKPVSAGGKKMGGETYPNLSVDWNTHGDIPKVVEVSDGVPTESSSSRQHLSSNVFVASTASSGEKRSNSLDKALRCKQKGNALFREGDYAGALEVMP